MAFPCLHEGTWDVGSLPRPLWGSVWGSTCSGSMARLGIQGWAPTQVAGGPSGAGCQGEGQGSPLAWVGPSLASSGAVAFRGSGGPASSLSGDWKDLSGREGPASRPSLMPSQASCDKEQGVVILLSQMRKLIESLILLPNVRYW